MESCIYRGHLWHRRVTPVEHGFRYALFMMYLDLAEVPRLLRNGVVLYGAPFSPASFRREDHFGDPRQPLDAAVRELVERRTAWRPKGPIRLLTNLRQFGYYFSPLNLFYCFDREDTRVEAVVAEVSNTPWLQRHCYVLWQGNRKESTGELEFQHPKAFHVSPFLDMDFDYHWRLTPPGHGLKVYLADYRGDERVFHAGLALRRRPLSRWEMLRTVLRHPMMCARIVLGIHWHALRLWRKGCPFYAHPKFRDE